ncbi:MAG: ATP-binding protein [Lachnospiraceae bacterium]|nr:ATP-binding protein [Lachnospiraceae bacterium]
MTKKTIQPFLAISLLIFLAVILSVGGAIWYDYRDAIMENHKDQLLITSEILAENMEISMADYRDNLRFLSRLWEAGAGEEIYRSYLETKAGFEKDIFWEDTDGNLVGTIMGTKLRKPLLFTEINEEESIFQYEDSSGKKYLVLKRTLDPNMRFCLAIDEEQYYQQLISNIRIGTNGYIVVKNSQGQILMHPEEEQWGIHVIEGRRALYPDLDYSSLEDMVREQCNGSEGISEYFSYWWGSPSLTMVKKISAYAPVEIGGDFWVISSVVDYDDFCKPIEMGFQKVSLLFIGTLAGLGLLTILVGKLLFDRKRNLEEIVALRELNDKLEEIHQGEEMLAHQQRLQVMGTMTGGIAHEFNNFLTPIMGYAEILMMEFPEDSDAYDNAKEIYEASEKAKDVVRQIASLSRRNVETVYKAIDADKLCIRALKMAESICPAHIHLEKEIDLKGISILGNATQINQVILNICVNAVQAIGKKEGCIRIQADCVDREELAEIPELELARISDEWRRYVRIRIADNGCGMDAETLRQIFIPFFTTKKTGEGTGLGLALAEQIVISHRGYLYAESICGKGATFFVFIPVMEEGSGKEVIHRDRLEMLELVIADDNVKILQMLNKDFSRLKNLKIFTCREKKELHHLLETEKPDALVIDAGIEGGSGVDFCMSVQGRYPDMLKFVMVDCFTKDIVEAKQKKVIDGYLLKPVSDTAILEIIRNSRENRAGE